MGTRIEWTDETINPLGWGCYGPGGTPDHPKVCPYCYAARFAKRHLVDCPDCQKFVPHWHEEQFTKPMHWKKPRKVFIQSMGDAFGDWVPAYRIAAIRDLCRLWSHHTYQLLTKNPKRLAVFNPWPDNCWVGVTATDQAMAETAVKELARVEAKVKFLSCEPLLGPIDVDLSGIQWLILGSQTGAKAVVPELDWANSLILRAAFAGVPVFVKKNWRYRRDGEIVQMKERDLRQEWPRGDR